MSANSSNLLTIVAGLASIYVILALIASHVTEWIASITKQRGALLEKGIVALLGGAQRNPQLTGNARQLVDYLYDHPLIGTLGVKGRPPSYIPPRTFTLSLLSALEDFTTANPGTAPPAKWQATSDQLLQGLQQQINALPPDNPLRAGLNTLLRNVTTDYETALKAIDSWFDAQMDRISGFYKRWATIIQVLVAALIVGLLNVDTIRIVLQLASGAINSAALSTVAQGSDQGVSQSIEALSKAGLTIGWSSLPATAGEWFVKFFGLLLTWFAVLLGAPFWFDLLKKIVPLRMSGAKPVRTKAHAKGDAQAKA